MHILLINTNPVVSRLLALCTREEDKILEEVEILEDAQREVYDIVFVDEDAYKDDVLEFSRFIKARKKVLFSKENIQIRMFDITIQKPFLPSQILEILDTGIQKKKEVLKTSIFPLSAELIVDKNETNVLDRNEIDKIKTLLDMDEETDMPPIETLTSEELEVRKVEAIKEQLISEGLEIVDEADIVKEIGLENEIISIFNTEIEKPKKKQDKGKKIKFTRKEREKIEDAAFVAIASLKKKQLKKLLKGKKVHVEITLGESKLYE